jgi:hypothetical protein
MTEFFSETFKKFDVAFDLKGEGIFKEGHTFEPMTYKSLCEHVAYESCRLCHGRAVENCYSLGCIKNRDYK